MTTIFDIVTSATLRQLNAAIIHTADHLHVPQQLVGETVAVAYVQRHFKSGELEGWDGFTEDIGGVPQPDPAEWGDTTREDMARHQLSGRLSVADPVDPITHMDGTHS